MTDESKPAVPDEPEGRGFDRHRPDDAVYQAFDPQPMQWSRGHDGLPSPEIQTHLPIAPPLSTSTMVCLADTSEFVLRRRGWGDVVGRFEPLLVERAATGEYYVDLLDAVASGAPWLDIARALDPFTGRVKVSPLRPQCEFLRQQMTDLQDNTEHMMLERLCTARRDDESFFVSLRDTQVHACELRTPRDPESERRIEKFNDLKLELGKERILRDGAFDVDEALRRGHDHSQDQGLEDQSIFSSRK